MLNNKDHFKEMNDIGINLTNFIVQNNLDKKEIVIAFPRNPLHVRFIAQNLKSYDLIIYREKFMKKFLDKESIRNTFFIGRELAPNLRDYLRKPFFIRAFNKNYYKVIFNQLIKLNIKKLIIFLENAPAECYLMDNISSDKIELWEEGIMHYMPIDDNLLWFSNALGQLLYGFFPKNIFRKRIDKNKFFIRDRFVNKNLILKSSIPLTKKNIINKGAFIGNVLSDDKILSTQEISNILEKISKKINLPIIFFPHPRESLQSIEDLNNNLTNTLVEIYQQPENTLDHFKFNSYRYYFSPFSSTLLEIDETKNCYWVPFMFGLKKLHYSLVKKNIFPVKTIKDFSEIDLDV